MTTDSRAAFEAWRTTVPRAHGISGDGFEAGWSARQGEIDALRSALRNARENFWELGHCGSNAIHPVMRKFALDAEESVRAALSPSAIGGQTDDK